MSPRAQQPRRLVAVSLAMVVAVAGCSRDDSIDSVEATATPSSAPGSSVPTTSPTTAPAPTTPASTTTTSSTPTTVETPATAATTAPAATAPAATTAASTTPASTITAAELTLAADGIDPFEFGDGVSVVLTGLTAALGAPNFDNTRTYPTADGDRYLDTIEEESFTHSVGRTVCFANDLCAQFGGDTDGTLTFTGWEVTTDAAPRLFTANGISIGSVMSDFLDSAEIADGGCYTVGYGDASGVTLTLLSSGEPFASFDDDGNYVLGSPPPDDIEVLGMSSGDLPYFLYEDC